MPDRNFDDIADYFAQRIHRGKKGQIRQAVIQRDLDRHLPDGFHHAPKRVLDIGGGLGHFAIQSAINGHEVHYNDLSSNMLQKAQVIADEVKQRDSIHWHNSPYQDLDADQIGQFDLIFCHAVIEWLEKPAELIPHLRKLLKPNGYISLCFYNPAGMTFRNLIRGNFNYLQHQNQKQPDNSSLTPTNPPSVEQVSSWLEERVFFPLCISGIRVFSDYTLDKRGGLADPNAVQEMELAFSDREPFVWIGRYLHYFVMTKC